MRNQRLLRVNGLQNSQNDDLQDYATNEPTMDGTARALLMWVVVNGE